MTDQEIIKECLRKLSLEGLKMLSCEACMVKSVEDNSCTVQSILSEIEYDQVLLQAYPGAQSGMIVTPKVDSVVWMVSIDACNRFVCMCSELEKIDCTMGEKVSISLNEKLQIDVEKISCEISKDGLVFNGGKLGGILKIEDVVKKINALEKEMNALKNVFSTSWVPVPQDGGAALKIAATSWAVNMLKETQKSELEDDKIKH
ncbi:MAG: hypothetical protein RR386_08820 [Bacteroidaceae bacterium]